MRNTTALCTTTKPPVSVLFDLTQAMVDYEGHIAQMNVAVLDTEALLSDIVNYLRYEFFYPGELQALMENIVDNSNDPIEEDLLHLGSAVMGLGKSVFYHLKEHGMFDENEQHHLKYDKLISNKILLLKRINYDQET